MPSADFTPDEVIPRALSPRLVRRAAVIAVVAPFLWFGAAGAHYLWDSREADRRASLAFGLALPCPTSSQRFLVFAPHPDDEVLGCGGLIKQAREAGAAVRVVYLTNGDGFRYAVERQYRTIATSAADFVRFGELRQEEALRAMAELGLTSANVGFLGYPDGSLLELWRRNWSEHACLRSPYTRAERVPYRRAERPDALYCGAALLSLVEREISDFRPTDVLVTHPADDHRDHAAASAFVTLAVTRIREASRAPDAVCRLRYYLIHRGNWPQPQGRHTRMRLAPPAEMLGLDTQWEGRALTHAQVRAKERAIRSYRSQMGLMGRFLLSFARTSEPFGDLRPVSVDAGGPGRGMQRGLTLAVNPTADNLMRRFRPQADIRSVEVQREGDRIVLAVRTVGRPTRATSARMFVRYFAAPGCGEAGGALSLGLRGARVRGADGATGGSDRTGFSASLPASLLEGAEALSVDVETVEANTIVDRTGPRAVLVKGRN